MSVMVGTLSERELLACCASARWAGELAAHQPYHDLETMWRVSDTVLAALPWADVLAALSAHPRIGERAAGDSREASWSRTEQSAANADAGRAAELHEGNIEYEKRFGHVFLICATGLPAGEVLAALRRRLANEPETEQRIVRDELRKIVRVRLAKLVG
jgi:2-oxo-4-hydroxy-4-carboxy-5-ureidoimidazoline decarboxylase